MLIGIDMFVVLIFDFNFIKILYLFCFLNLYVKLNLFIFEL